MTLSPVLQSKIIAAQAAVQDARDHANAERHKLPVDPDANEAFQCLAHAFDIIEDL